MIVVTGGAGFIGSVFLAKLNSLGISDILVVDDLGETDKWKNLNGKQFTDYLHKDQFIDRIRADQLDLNISGVMHLGACSSTTEKDAEYLISNNYHYTKDLATWAISKGIRFVYASSAATYGAGEHGFSDNHEIINNLRPLNMYGYSKQMFDLWALKTGAIRDILGVKFFNVYGPNEYHKEDMKSVVCKAYHQITETGSLKLFKSHVDQYQDGEQLRDFIYVKDCAEVLMQFLNSSTLNGIFNLGTGKARSFKDLGKAVFSALNVEEKIDYMDMPEKIRPNYQYFTEADMTKLSSISDKLAFTSLEDGVKDYVDNFLSNNSSFY